MRNHFLVRGSNFGRRSHHCRFFCSKYDRNDSLNVETELPNPVALRMRIAQIAEEVSRLQQSVSTLTKLVQEVQEISQHDPIPTPNNADGGARPRGLCGVVDDSAYAGMMQELYDEKLEWFGTGMKVHDNHLQEQSLKSCEGQHWQSIHHASDGVREFGTKHFTNADKPSRACYAQLDQELVTHHSQNGQTRSIDHQPQGLHFADVEEFNYELNGLLGIVTKEEMRGNGEPELGS